MACQRRLLGAALPELEHGERLLREHFGGAQQQQREQPELRGASRSDGIAGQRASASSGKGG